VGAHRRHVPRPRSHLRAAARHGFVIGGGNAPGRARVTDHSPAVVMRSVELSGRELFQPETRLAPARHFGLPGPRPANCSVQRKQLEGVDNDHPVLRRQED
jgi:hypothetical protein